LCSIKVQIINGGIRLTEIILDGVVENKRTAAYSEIKQILDMIFSDGINPVDLIRISREFQGTVQNFLKSYGQERLWDPHHEYGIACAKTIPYLKGEKLAFTIILDGNFIGAWTEEQYFFRTATLIHELIHVKDDQRRWAEIGTKFFEEPTRKQECLFHNAWIIWEEYKANRVVAELFEKIAEEIKGKVNYSFALGHADTLHDLLKDIREYVKRNIQDFRFYKLTPTEICYRITSRICGILVLCAYAYAIVDFSNELKEKIVEVEKLDGYQFLLSENWPKIHSILKELYGSAKEYHPELINKIADEIDEIYQKCGLQISDVEKGLWVNVHDIN